ncbi:hypothetical protein Mgra_00002387 [Meloidogyne graminicola]|uniref:Uncharacterized protein n=1 Tax=Meloidogyne graminicola TaxID=189291 RepID=A0A8S9ZWX8_9BILA|nr:hypothetical protein Mgra_00002387 [Meloidogyne graminicola]
MLLNTTTTNNNNTTTTTQSSTIGSDFRLIDEQPFSINSQNSTPLNKNNEINSLSSSSIFLIAEQQSFTGEVSLQMLEKKLNETNLDISKQNNRKRLSSDSNKLINNYNALNSIKTFDSSTVGLSEIRKEFKDEEMPLVDDLIKSDDIISLNPSMVAASALVIDFRSDLLKLRESVKKDLEELDILRKQNASLQEQLTERNKIILQLQRQLRGDL